MPDPVTLTITAEDAASPVLQQVRQTLDGVVPSAAQVQQGLTSLTNIEAELQQQTQGSAAQLTQLGQILQQQTQSGQLSAQQTQLLTQALAQLTQQTQGLGQLVTQGAQQLQLLGQSAAQTTGQVQQATPAVQAHTASWEDWLATGAKVAIGFASVQAVMSAVKTLFVDGIGAASDYQSAMATVQIVTQNTADAQQALSDKLLALPPILGSAAALAGDFSLAYRSLQDSAQALQVTEAAARLAAAANADLGRTTQGVLEVMQQYRLSADEASRVADVFFTTQTRGVGSLEGFIQAVGTVVPLAQKWNISFEDVIATLTTLSVSLKSPEAAGQALMALLRTLITHQGEFAAEGINIKQALGEGGLMGLLQAMRPILEGHDENLKTLLGGYRNYTAVLELLGPLQTRLIADHQATATAIGGASAALETRSKTLATSWQELKNEGSNLASTLLGPVVTALTAVTASLNEDTKFLGALVTGHLAWSDAAKQAILDQQAYARETAALAATLNQLDVTQTTLTKDEQAHATEMAKLLQQYPALATASHAMQELALSEQHRLEDVTDATKTFGGALKDLSAINLSDDKIQTYVTNGTKALTTMASSGKVSFAQLQADAEKWTDAVLAKVGYLPDAVQKVYTEILDRGEESTNDLEQAWQHFGLTFADTAGAAQLKAQQLGDSFDLLARQGDLSTGALEQAWRKTVAAFNTADITQLSDTFIDDLAKMNEHAELLGQTQSHVFVDMEGHLKVVTNAQLGLQDTSVQVYQHIATEAAIAFESILNKGTITTTELERNVNAFVKKVNESDFTELPPFYQTVLDKMNAATLAATGDMTVTYTDAFGKIQMSAGTMGAEVEKQFQRLRGQTQDEAQRAAQTWMTEFQHMVDSGQYSHEQLTHIAQQEVGKMREAYDTLPPEFQTVMDDLGLAADKTAAHITDTFRQSTKDVLDMWTSEEDALNKQQADLFRNLPGGGGGAGGGGGGSGQTLTQLSDQLTRLAGQLNLASSLGTAGGVAAAAAQQQDVAAKLRDAVLAQMKTTDASSQVFQTLSHYLAQADAILHRDLQSDLASLVKDTTHTTTSGSGGSSGSHAASAGGGGSPGGGAGSGPLGPPNAYELLSSGSTSFTTGQQAIQGYMTALAEGLPDAADQQKVVLDLLKHEGTQLRILNDKESDRITITDKANKVLLEYIDLHSGARLTQGAPLPAPLLSPLSGGGSVITDPSRPPPGSGPQPGAITIGGGPGAAAPGGAPSGGSQAAPAGGTTVHAPITVHLHLTSPISRIDAQNLVTTITPALQEAINRRQLLLGGVSTR
jgi:TP901 family phage tail tape measure protein